MGCILSDLNFIFLSNTYKKNGGDSFIQGPFYNYLTSKKNRNRYSVSFNGKIKKGFKNILFFEGRNKLKSFYETDFKTKYKTYIENKEVKILCISLADPSSNQEFEDYKLHFQEYENKILNLDSNTGLDTKYTIDYFFYEYLENRDNIFSNDFNELGYLSEEISENEIDVYRNKKFLSFNRNMDKYHRLTLLEEYLNGTYKDSYFSFLMKLPTNVVDDLGRDRFRYGKKSEYNKHLPIELDTHGYDKKDSFRSHNTLKKELFLDSCIHIVTETSFDHNESFISEKIIKPIIMYQPFIVLGPYHYLKKIKKIGFKTFSDFWDESYDEKIKWEDRADEVIKIIRKINSMSIDEVNEIYKKTKNICIYNRNLFYSLSRRDMLQKILKDIENEW